MLEKFMKRIVSFQSQAVEALNQELQQTSGFENCELIINNPEAFWADFWESYVEQLNREYDEG